MRTILRRCFRQNRGQALPLVLALLAIGGLTIAANLSYATTGLNGNRIVEEQLRGIYAAGGGVEYAAWRLARGLSGPTGLSENLSQMAVDITPNNRGVYSLTRGDMSELEQSQRHYEYLEVSGDMTPYGDGYLYTITVTWNATSGYPKIHLTEIGARIPVGYSYATPPAPSGLSSFNPAPPKGNIEGDISTGYVIYWELSPSNAYLDSPTPTTVTQTFYIIGSGSAEGDYTWVESNDQSIGLVGEVTGTLWRVTATARSSQGGRAAARIVSDLMVRGGSIYILSWQIGSE